VRLLLDQGLPRRALVELAALGFDAVHAGDIGMAMAADEELLARARQDKRTVVTLDADFHAILALSNAPNPSVVRLRIQGMRAPQLALLLKQIFDLCVADIRTGAMVTADERSVRVHLLPLVPP